MNESASGKLIIPGSALPEELKGKKALTLDQLDARDVKVELAVKKSYRIPRVKITNKSLTLLVSPRLAVPIVKDILLMAVEARRRLRHPNNQSHADPIEGIAWGRLGSTDEKFWDTLFVTIAGKAVTAVTLEDAKREEKDDDPGNSNPEADQLHSRLITQGRP